ncbi:FG-GAP-like repeat-containing protein [Salibacteraceae bacterium]|nr:FG-GAP-like repeat-containing protein [Salibacteraceae bacterium]MDB4105259.1 FG-GAP-like repeat-containing protein [Salibacteraceae bacterium]MDC1304812.1 FG-GAP-like repeat-containing protein [Salibacteraceae bacterium]
MKKSRVHFLALLVFFLFESILVAQPQFVDKAPELGLTETYSVLPFWSGGLSFRDFDQDGWDDITMSTDTGRTIKFFRNRFGVEFEEVNIITTGLHQQFSSMWIDFDNDGDLDFLSIRRLDGVELYKNQGNMNFIEVSAQVGLSGLGGGIFRTGASIGDFNNDGLVDLYLPNYGYDEENKMFFQDTNHFFQNVSNISGTGDSLKATFHGVLIDYNHDGNIDIYLANDGHDGNTLFKNNGDSTFTDVSQITGTNVELDAMGLTVGDFDGDLDLDIYVTDKINSNLLQLNSNGTFSEVAAQKGVDFYNGFGWGTNFFDADFDGDEDLYVSSTYIPIGLSEPSILYINDGSGNYSNIQLLKDSGYSFVNVLGDFNNDRLTDVGVLSSNNDPMKMWKNETPVNVGRITLKIEGCSTHKDAFGSQVIAYDGTQSRLYSFQSCETFLGQNSDKKIIPILNGATLDSLTVTWPNGSSTTIYGIEQNQTLIVSECSLTRPLPVIMVPNYSSQGLVSCSGESVLLCVNGDYPNVVWSNGLTSDSIYVNSAGIYTVTVTNQFGASATSASVVIIEREYPDYTIESEIASCFTDGSIHLIPADSSVVYSYQWSNQSTSDSLSNLNPGVYYVTVTDQGECAMTDSVIINGPANFTPIYFNGSTEDVLCYDDSSGIISVFPTGGSAPYQYLWSNQETTSSIAIPAGNYHLTVADSYGCQRDTSFTINEPDQILAYIDVIPDTNSAGKGMISLDVFGGTPPYSIVWNDLQNQTGDSAINLIAGEYIAQITDSRLCLREIELTVPNSNINGDQIIRSKECDLICTNLANSILVQLPDRCPQPFSTEEMNVFNIQGLPINFQSRQISATKKEIVTDEQGVFLIRDNTGRSCKVLRITRF